MLEITEAQWQKVQELYLDKLKRIEELEAQVKELDVINDALVINNEWLKDENNTLQNKVLKLEKEQHKTDASLSVCLQQLNQALNTMETYGLRNRKSRITADNLLDIVG